MTVETFINSVKLRGDMTGMLCSDFDKFVQDCGGIEKLKRNDLEKIIYEFPNALTYENFSGIYNYVATKETADANSNLSEKMLFHTRLMSVLTVIVTIATIVNLVIYLCS